MYTDNLLMRAIITYVAGGSILNLTVCCHVTRPCRAATLKKYSAVDKSHPTDKKPADTSLLPIASPLHPHISPERKPPPRRLSTTPTRRSNTRPTMERVTAAQTPAALTGRSNAPVTMGKVRSARTRQGGTSNDTHKALFKRIGTLPSTGAAAAVRYRMRVLDKERHFQVAAHRRDDRPAANARICCDGTCTAHYMESVAEPI